jgi:hypothetical protein
MCTLSHSHPTAVRLRSAPPARRTGTAEFDLSSVTGDRQLVVPTAFWFPSIGARADCRVETRPRLLDRQM